MRRPDGLELPDPRATHVHTVAENHILRSNHGYHIGLDAKEKDMTGKYLLPVAIILTLAVLTVFKIERG